MKVIVPREFEDVDLATKQTAIHVALAMHAEGLTKVDPALFVEHLRTLLTAAGTTTPITDRDDPTAWWRAAAADMAVSNAVASIAIDNYHTAQAAVAAYEATEDLFGDSLTGARWTGHPDRTATATIDGRRFSFDAEHGELWLLDACPTNRKHHHATVIAAKEDLATALETPEAVRWVCQVGLCEATNRPADHDQDQGAVATAATATAA